MINAMLNIELDLHSIIGSADSSAVKNIKKYHKDISTCMKQINDYYATRLKNDHLINDKLMKYLSLCEIALSQLDMSYENIISDQYTGDLAKAYKDYQTKYRIVYRNSPKDLKVDIPPDQYLGYIKSGKTTKQIVEEYAEYIRLREIPDAEQTSEEQKKFRILQREFFLAKDFAYASRFFLHKDDYTVKDIRYAFLELPKTEFTGGDDCYGDFKTFHSPSATYQAAILGKVFYGMRSLDFAGKDKAAKTQMMDEFMSGRMNEHKDYMSHILSAFIEEKTETSTEDLIVDFINGAINTYVDSSIKSVKLSELDRGSILMGLHGMETSKQWLRSKIEELRNRAPNPGA